MDSSSKQRSDKRPRREITASPTLDHSGDFDFLCKFLGISNEKHARGLEKGLEVLGCDTLQDLVFLQEQDLNGSALPPLIQRKLLAAANYVQQGGSLRNVSSIQELLESKKNNTSTDTEASLLESNPTQALDGAIIHLNVGGHKFTTTKDTLCRVQGSLLEVMFSGRHENPAQRDRDGAFVIDRDGGQFQHILSFLRVGSVISLPVDATSREELAIEADYYGLKDLVRAVRMPQVDTSEHLPEEVLSMRQTEDGLRKDFMSGIGKHFGPHRSLISFFSPDDCVQPLPLLYQPNDEHKCDAILMDSLRVNPPPGTPVTVKSLEEFKTCFNIEHPNLLGRLSRVLSEEPIVIAGGAVLRALTALPDVRTAAWWGEKSDVDLFLYCGDRAEANRIARRVFYALAVDNERWAVVRSRGVITMHNWVGERWNSKVDLKVQIVLRLYDSPAEVLLGFDCDCCCCAFDGRDVWVTPRCARALRTGFNILNSLHSWPNKPSYELRLGKYAFRGFAVVVPGLDRKRINYDEIRGTNLRELKGLARLLKVAFEMDASPVEKRRSGTEAFPLPPLRVKSLNVHTCESMSEADLTTRGMASSGYFENGDEALIVPEVYGSSSRPYGLAMIWWWGFPDDFPEASRCRDSAWNDIVHAPGRVPEGIPALLIDSWDTEKRSREYLNADMDAFDRDNVYYGHGYEEKTV